MTLLHLVVIAIAQGITEFLPISSSAHLILVPYLFGWPDQGLLIDVAVHVGTLGAVMVYFWRDVGRMIVGLRRLAGGVWDDDAKLVAYVVVATVPVVVGGLALKLAAPEGIRSVVVLAWANLVAATLLWICDRYGRTDRRLQQLTLKDTIVFGLMQMLALIPGTSRSGITMTAGRMLGFSRDDTARFSLLMSIPTLAAAGTLAGKDLYDHGDAALTGDAFLAALLAFVAALAAIALMMAWLRRASFTPFVVYRIALGLTLLAFIYGILG